MTVQVRYFAAAADAVGTAGELITLPASADLVSLTDALVVAHGPRLARILAVSAFLVDGELTRDRSTPVSSTVDVLPPFAGG